MIHPEAKFLFSCKPVKQDQIRASKIQWWDRHKIGNRIPKDRHQKEGVMGLKLVQDLAGQIPLALNADKGYSLAGCSTLRPTGVALLISPVWQQHPLSHWQCFAPEAMSEGNLDN